MRAPLTQNVSRTGRKTRSPAHTWIVRSKPYVLQPIAIAPVLPGETLSSLLWQCRAQTEQLRNALAGWHMEFYWFYVKLSQLDTPEKWIAPATGMLMNPSATVSGLGLTNSAQLSTYHEDTASVNYVKRCRDIVVREYFRDQGEDETTALGLVDTTEPVVMAHLPGWMDSIMLTSTLTTLSPDLPDDADNAELRDIERLTRQYEMLEMLGMAEMTYEDFLATFGIGSPKVDDKKPEILRWAKFWQLPATAVDGATGTTSSVVSWKTEGRADKDRLFKEHGFICGYVTYRPKALYTLQQSAAATLLKNAWSWAPAMFDKDFPGTTIVDYPDGEGPLPAAVSAGWTVDTKDLFIHGDQFTNLDLSSVTDVNGGGFSADPTVRFPSTTTIDNLFVAANATNLVHNDGIVRLNIKSALRDTTPRNLGHVRLGG